MSDRPAEEQPATSGGGGDPLAGYEFTIECDLIHRGQPCHQEAVYSVSLHKCGYNEEGKTRDVPGGQQRLVCGWFVKETIGVCFPFRCATCGHHFGGFDEFIWNIQPIGSQK